MQIPDNLFFGHLLVNWGDKSEKLVFQKGVSIQLNKNAKFDPTELLSSKK